MININPSTDNLLEERWDNISKQINLTVKADEPEDLTDLFYRSYFIKQMKFLDSSFATCQKITSDIINTYEKNFIKLFPEQLHPIIHEEIIHLLAIKYFLRTDFSESSAITPTKLSDIFTNDSFPECVKILKDGCKEFKPVISHDGKYIGGFKGKAVIAAWFSYLHSKGVINKNFHRDTTLAYVLKEFPGLSITTKALYQKGEKGEGTFNKHFVTISNLL